MVVNEVLQHVDPHVRALRKDFAYLAPEQAVYLRENLKLQLLNAIGVERYGQLNSESADKAE